MSFLPLMDYVPRQNRFLPLLVAALCCTSGLNARANLLTVLPDMGDLSHWGAFSLGRGVNSTDTIDQFMGNSEVFGDVGVAGAGNIFIGGNVIVNGDLFWRSNGTLTITGDAPGNGPKHHNAASNPILDNCVTEAENMSRQAAGFASSFAYSGITKITSSTALNSQGSLTVLNLTDLVLTGRSTLTLRGSAADNVIINVSGNFSLTAQSKIVLTGGLAWDDVLFNIKGTGNDVTLDGQSTVTGIIMANQRTMSAAGASIVYGEVIANRIKLAGSSQIIHPPITSP
jgi:hypothetical protein